MVGTVDQLISLVTFGNDFLTTGRLAKPEEFYPESPSFRACIVVDFRNLEKDPHSSDIHEKVIAYNPTHWLMVLEDEGCTKLRLYFRSYSEPELPPEYKLAGFIGGGGDWLIESVHAGYSHYWAARWEVTSPDNPDGRIWSVHYARTAEQYQISEVPMDLQKVKQQFINTLSDIADFAYSKNCQNWGDIFSDARQLLISPKFTGRNPYGGMMPNQNYTEDALRLLAASGAAWVFGGMGSWNDLGYFESPDDQERYDRLTGQLYTDITQAIIAAVNSY